MESFGSRLKKARKEKKLTLRQLADLISVKYSSISEWENDHHRPDLDTLEKLAKTLDVEVSLLLSAKENNTNPEFSSFLRGELDDLSDEAKKEIDNFIAYIKTKYPKKTR
jgi:transcriptional regulator with XRE-family HTH domain